MIRFGQVDKVGQVGKVWSGEVVSVGPWAFWSVDHGLWHQVSGAIDNWPCKGHRR